MTDSHTSQTGLGSKLTWVFRFFMIFVLAFLILPATYTAFAEDGDFTLHAEDAESNEPQISEEGWVLDGDTLTIRGEGVVATSIPTTINYSNKKNIENLVIEDGVTGFNYEGKTYEGLFSDLDNLKTVKLPKSLKIIGANTFRKCKSLDSIEFGGVESIGESAFRDCKELVNGGIASTSIRTIGNNAFYSCDKLSVTAFPETLESIGKYAFYGCDELKITSLPNNLESIDEGAFAFCSKIALRDLTSSKIVTIEKETFRYCQSLENLILPDSLESIGEDAFKDCKNLKSIVFNNLKEYDNYIFSDCGSLESIEFKCPAPTLSITMVPKKTKLIVPADDPSWTDEVRMKLCADENNVFYRESNGSLTQALYIPLGDNVVISLGDEHSVDFDGKLDSSKFKSFSFNISSATTVDIDFGFVIAWKGILLIELKDQMGEIIDWMAFSNESYSSIASEGKHCSYDLEAGTYHIEFTYMNTTYPEQRTGITFLTSERNKGTTPPNNEDNSNNAPSNNNNNNQSNQGGNNNNNGGSGNSGSSANSGESNGVKYSVSDPSGTNVKVTANFGGRNVSAGDKAMIEVVPVSIPSEISSKMNSSSLGAYEVNLYVTNSDGSKTKQVHEGFGSLSLSFPTGDGANDVVTVHHLHGKYNQAYAEYEYSFSGFDTVCTVHLNNDMMVLGVIEDHDCVTAEDAQWYYETLYSKWIPLGAQVRMEGSTHVVLEWPSNFKEVSLDYFKDTYLYINGDVTVISEPTRVSSHVTSHTAKVDSKYASLEVDDLSTFTVEATAADATQKGDSTQNGKGLSSMASTGDMLIFPLGMIFVLLAFILCGFTLMVKSGALDSVICRSELLTRITMRFFI